MEIGILYLYMFMYNTYGVHLERGEFCVQTYLFMYTVHVCKVCAMKMYILCSKSRNVEHEWSQQEIRNHLFVQFHLFVIVLSLNVWLNKWIHVWRTLCADIFGTSVTQQDNNKRENRRSPCTTVHERLGVLIPQGNFMYRVYVKM